MEKPIVLVIMDGVGKGDGGSGDAVKNAKTPTLDSLLATCPHTYLKAHGTAGTSSSWATYSRAEVAGTSRPSSRMWQYAFITPSVCRLPWTGTRPTGLW